MTPIIASPISSITYSSVKDPDEVMYELYAEKFTCGSTRYAIYPASAIFAARGTERMENSGSVMSSAKQRTATRRKTRACATIVSIMKQRPLLSERRNHVEQINRIAAEFTEHPSAEQRKH